MNLHNKKFMEMYNLPTNLNCGHGIMAITSAFQADDAGSIPAARSRNNLLFE